MQNPKTTTIDIALLGGFQITVNGDASTDPVVPRLQRLVASLVLHRAAPLTRSRLAALLWPETSDAQSRTNLRNLFFVLRRDHPDLARLLAVSSEGEPGATSLWIDTEAMDAAIDRAAVAEAEADWEQARAALREAVSLYRGDLLPEFYDDWIVPPREYYRARVRSALARLASLYDQERAWPEAIAAIDRLLRIDPLDEQAWRHLMQLHAANNDPGAALAAFRACASTLEAELGEPPAAETQELRDLIGRAARMPVDRALPRFAGREQEWLTLCGLARDTARGMGPLLVTIAGDAGIGKSRLAGHLLDWGAGQGFAIAIARAYAAEGDLSFGPVVDVLRAPDIAAARSRLDEVWRGELARLLPEILGEFPDLAAPGPITEPWQRLHLFEAMSRAVIAPGRPLLLLIDDLQWCDRDTLEWLHRLLTFGDATRVMVIATIRTGDANAHPALMPLTHTMIRRDRLHEIDLGPLSVRETIQLAASMDRRYEQPSPDADHLIRVSEGNPLFVVEMVGAGLPSTSSHSDVGREAGGPPLPPAIMEAIQSRLGQLSPEALVLARIAAVTGRAFSSRVLACAWDGQESVFLASLEELEDRRVIRLQDGDTYDFTHDMLRQVIYHTITPARRRVYHRTVAQGLEQVYAVRSGDVGAQIAAHYQQAGEDLTALTWWIRAARVSQAVFAHDDALAKYERAEALLSGVQADSRTIRDLFEGMAGTLVALGRHDQALVAYSRALDVTGTPDGIDRARLLRGMARPLQIQRRSDEALALLDDAAACLEAMGRDEGAAWREEWLNIQFDRMDVYYYEGCREELQRQIDFLRDHVDERENSKYLRCQLRNSFLWHGYNGTDEQVRLGMAYLETVERRGETADLAFGHFGLGFLLWQARDPGAVAELSAGLALAERSGDLAVQARCLTYLAVDHRRRGDLAGARLFAERALDVSQANHMREYVAAATANLAWVAWREGRATHAREGVTSALAIWRDEGIHYPFQGLALWPGIALALEDGLLEDAVAHGRALLAPGLHVPLPDIALALETAWSAAESGDMRKAEHYLGEALDRAKALGEL